ncbi:hypothetical protein STENM223S_01310 [Streptomyces tendae]
MAMPTAVPRMPASASGVSVQRSSPNSLARPSVIRKTPPSVPTSSPMTCTDGSSVMASRNARVRACAMVAGFTATAVMAALLPTRPRPPARREPFPLLQQLGRGLGVHMREQVHGVQLRVLVHAGAQTGGHRLGVLPGADAGLVQQAASGQSPLQQGDRVVRPPGLDLGVAAVAGRVVGVGVGVHAVGDRLDQGRAAARAGAAHRVGEDLVHGGRVEGPQGRSHPAASRCRRPPRWRRPWRRRRPRGR